MVTSVKLLTEGLGLVVLPDGSHLEQGKVKMKDIIIILLYITIPTFLVYCLLFFNTDFPLRILRLYASEQANSLPGYLTNMTRYIIAVYWRVSYNLANVEG